MDVVWLWHTKDSSIAVPFTDIMAFDMPHPGTLVLETLSLTATIEGIGLEAVFSRILEQRTGVLRATDRAAPDSDGNEGHITRVTVVAAASASPG
jgi:hypothetical protein